MSDETKAAIADVLAECQRQDKRRGHLNHTPAVWSLMLTKECGEFAHFAFYDFVGGDTDTELRAKAIQVCTIALQTIMCLDRKNSAHPV